MRIAWIFIIVAIHLVHAKKYQLKWSRSSKSDKLQERIRISRVSQLPGEKYF